MQLTRTTVRFRSPLKKAAEMKAVELDITFQALLERALELYLNQESYKKARKLVFRDKNIGVPLDHLNREDIYADWFKYLNLRS